MKIKEIMTGNPAFCTPQTALQEVAQLMVDNDCGCIPVIENETSKVPYGVITDRDITARVVAKGLDPSKLKAADAMTADVVTVMADTSLEKCCDLMKEKQIRRVVVVDDKGACVGMISQADLAINASEQKTAEVVQEISRTAAA